MTVPAPTAPVEERLERIERAIKTLAWWSHQAPGGLGVHDVRGIEDILDGKKDES